MRIVITKKGKKEFKEEDYEDINTNSLFNQNNRQNKRTISYNKNQRPLSIYRNQYKNRQRVGNSIEQKIDYNNSLSPIRKINTNNNLSFLSKIGEFSINPKNLKTPYKTNKNYVLYNNNITQINNKNFLNNNSDNNESIFKNVSISQKKLNMPKIMLDKYSKESLMKTIETENYLNSNNDKEEQKIKYTESNSSPLDKDKMISLRELLNPKNKRKVDDIFLDKKININGGESIINYLQMDKTISPSFIEKINKYNDEQLYKLDKVCQKYFDDKKIKSNLDDEIKQKIKNEYEQESIYYKNSLKNMNNNLKSYNNIYKRLRLKKEYYEKNKNSYLSHENND